jgi:hypothetical protein
MCATAPCSRQSSWAAPEEIKVEGSDERALIYRGGETIEWRVAENVASGK